MGPLKNLKQKHLKCIELEILHPEWSLKQLASELGASYPAVLKWVKSPVYMDERDRRLKEEWRGAIKIAQATIIRLAGEGNREAAQYLLKCNGYEPKSESDINLKTQDTISIKITGDSDE